MEERKKGGKEQKVIINEGGTEQGMGGEGDQREIKGYIKSLVCM